MKIRDWIILGIFVIFILPGLIEFSIWAIKSVTNPTPENIEEGAEKLAESVIPWWIRVIEWLTSLPAIIAAISIIVVIWFLKWIGEIK